MTMTMTTQGASLTRGKRELETAVVFSYYPGIAARAPPLT
jgi:hypothetical protein